jgi:hypothetical protein
LSWLSCACIVASGCIATAAKRPVADIFTMAPDARSFPPVAENEVAVYNIDEPTKLPAGVLGPGGGSRRVGGSMDLLDFITLEAGYPTADDPHRKLGMLVLRDADVPERRNHRSVLAEQAGLHGANAIVILSYKLASVHKAVALHLSSAQPRYMPAAELLQTTPEKLDGYSRGAVIERKLEAFSEISIEGTGGTCYAVHAALDSDAILENQTRQNLGIHLDKMGVGAMSGVEVFTVKNAPVSMRELVVRLGCASHDGPVRFVLSGGRIIGGDGTKLHGKGRMFFQIYSRSSK